MFRCLVHHHTGDVAAATRRRNSVFRERRPRFGCRFVDCDVDGVRLLGQLHVFKNINIIITIIVVRIEDG